MAITKVQQSALLTQLWTPDDAWQSPGNVTLSGVSAGNLVLTFGAWWDTGGGGGGAQQIPTDSNGTLAAGISPAFPSASPPNWPVSGQILRILSAAAGNHVITPPVLGVDGDGLFFAAEFSGGVAGTWTQVEVNSNVVLSATPGAVDGVSVSTAGAAQVGDLVVALCTTDGDPSAIGVGAPSGYANEILLTTTTTVNIAAGAGWMIATSAGAQTASWAWADTACQLGQACIAVFRFTPSGPTITGQPSDQTVNNGATATFSVTATGTAPITYQWQDNSSGSFADIGGATSSSYAPTASYAMQGRQYRCVVTDANGNVTSNAVTLTVAYNLSGTGPRFSLLLGYNPLGLAPSAEFVRGTNTGGGGSTITQAGAADGRGPATASVIVIAAGVSHARGDGGGAVQVIVAGAADARGQAAGSSAQTIAVAGAAEGRGQAASNVALAATGAAEGRGPAAGGTVIAAVAAGAAEGRGPAAGLVALAVQGNSHSISQTADAVLVIASGQSGAPTGSSGGAALAVQGAAQAASQAAGVAASGGSGVTAGESGGPSPATGLVVIAVAGVSTGGGAGAGSVAQTIAVAGEAGAPSGASVGVVISTRGESGAQGPAAANSVVLAVIPGVSQSNGGAAGLGVDGSAPVTQASPYVGFIVNPGQLMKR